MKGGVFRKDRFDTDYQIGQDNVKKWGMDVHPVFFVVASLVVVFIILTLWNPVEAKKVFDWTKSWTIKNVDLCKGGCNLG